MFKSHSDLVLHVRSEPGVFTKHITCRFTKSSKIPIRFVTKKFKLNYIIFVIRKYVALTCGLKGLKGLNSVLVCRTKPSMGQILYCILHSVKPMCYLLNVTPSGSGEKFSTLFWSIFLQVALLNHLVRCKHWKFLEQNFK